jgi:hypothetical protein
MPYTSAQCSQHIVLFNLMCRVSFAFCEVFSMSYDVFDLSSSQF